MIGGKGMRRVQVLVLFIISVTVGILNAAEWAPIADKLGQSVVYIENGEGSCTGFVINANYKQDTDLVLTAAHCDGSALMVDHMPGKVIWKDAKQDLLVVQIDDSGRPAVTIGKKDPANGDELASFGYGYGLEKPMLRIAHVSNASIELPEIEGGPFVMIDAGYVGGQSGGPCVNASGEVVSIVQRASGLVGIGVGAERIRGKVGRYLEKPKP
jgi:S1-C subfamily serine protease